MSSDCIYLKHDRFTHLRADPPNLMFWQYMFRIGENHREV
jgi:hypothetical protein